MKQQRTTPKQAKMYFERIPLSILLDIARMTSTQLTSLQATIRQNVHQETGISKRWLANQ